MDTSKKVGLATAAITGLLLAGSSNAFATNAYNIQYVGGSPLGSSNIQIDAAKAATLTELVGINTAKTYNFSSSNKWLDGYEQIGEGDNAVCKKVKYFKVWNDDSIDFTNGMSYSINADHYKAVVDFNNIVFDGITDLTEDNAAAIIVEYATDGGAIATRRAIYSDAACQTPKSDITAVSEAEANGGLLFVETNVKIQKTADSSPISSTELYFGIADVDSAQSYKILNTDSLLKKANMFAVDASALQPSEQDATLKNMYVSDDNYIYSEFNITEAPHHFNITDENNLIYVKLGEATQANGLDVVFGYGAPGGSNVFFYAKQYVVKYVSDAHGSITGITSETVPAGNTPTGSTQAPAEGYVFDFWTADVDVSLKMAPLASAGEKIPEDQIKSIIVNQDITFTAFHKAAPATKEEPTAKTPDTGRVTGGNNAILIAGIALPVFLVTGFLAHYAYDRKKHMIKF